MTRRLIHISKKSHYLKFFNENKDNSKKIWKGINNILNRQIRDETSNIFINCDGNLITEPKCVANSFNNFYSSIANKLVKDLPKPNTKFQDYLKNPNKHELFLKEIDPGEIRDLLKDLDISKAADIYGFSPKLLKIGYDILCYPLAAVFNLSFSEGIFPTKLKCAKVIPVHKGDSKLLASNYRPISLLPILSKLLEKLMYTRVFGFVSEHNLLFKRQFGFQPGKSTELALVNLQSKIIGMLEKQENPYLILLDFAKAFDTVNHDILLQKLWHYGIRDTAFDWFKSYLLDRKQCVAINNCHSDFKDVLTGVPQGSILGPLLFLLYINDIYQSSELLNFFLFADDTCILFSHKNKQYAEMVINRELVKLSDWLTANKLSLNIKKSHVICFRPKNASNTLNSNILINGVKVTEKVYAKYLGVLIDNKLTYKAQIEVVKQKVSKGISLLAKLRHFVPPDTLKKFYYAQIQPFIDYGILDWSVAAQSNLQPLEKTIDKAVRILTFSKYDADCIPLYKNKCILPLSSCIKFAQGKFIWKNVRQLEPNPIGAFFDENRIQNNGRKPGRLIPPQVSHEVAKNSVTYSGIMLWNSIPDDIFSKATFPSFLNGTLKDILSLTCDFVTLFYVSTFI